MLSLGYIVRKSRSSLFWCMQSLPKAQREAVYTLYAFCCHIDDIIRSSINTKEKEALLKAWSEELDNIYNKKVPATNIGRKIYKNCMRFNLEEKKFEAILESAYLNVPKPLFAPKQDVFEKFVYGISIAPLEMILQITSQEKEQIRRDLAYNLGMALITSLVLKDLKSDAQKGRLYIPREILERANVKITTPLGVIEDKNLIAAREELAKITEKSLKNTWRILNKMNKKETLTLRFIVTVCQCYFDIMKQRGWEIIAPKPHIGAWKKIKIVYKILFF